MSQRIVNGGDVLLFIDVNGVGNNYDLIVCLTSQSIKRTTGQIDAASKCGPSIQPGAQTVTVDFEGQIAAEMDSNQISAGYLHDIWADKRTIKWKLAPAIPKDGDLIYTGSGFISDLTDTYPNTDVATFSGTIGVQGTVSRVIQGS